MQPASSNSLGTSWRDSIDRAVATGLKGLYKPEPLTLSQWADKNFYLSPESSSVEGPWETLPPQKGIMDCISNDDIEVVTWRKSARTGYALALDTPLPTPTGWTTMGDVQEGDWLLDEAGRPCRVTFTSPVYTDHNCYRVRFCDGSQIVADEGHRWYVESDNSFEYLLGQLGSGRIGRPSPKQKITKRGVVTTGQMAQMARTARGRNALAIPVAAPLDLPDATLSVPPYTLGLWLGDGHMVSPRITQHCGDIETADYIREEGIDVQVGADGVWPNNRSYRLDTKGKRISPWARVLRSMGLLSPGGAKHIPPAYLRASWRQRLALLQGLMDSDGTIGADGRAEFVNTNRALADGVYELVASLGMKVSMQDRAPQREGCLPQFRVGFKPTPDVNPFRLQRKAGRVLRAAKPAITKRRRIVAVEACDTVRVKCVGVDSPQHLFLCGRGMIPTHNTKIIVAAICYFGEHKKRNTVCFQPTNTDAEEFVKDEIGPAFRDVDVVRDIFPDHDKKSKNNTLQKKVFSGSTHDFRGGESPRNYRRLTKDVAIYDELSSFVRDVGGEGKATDLGDVRITTSSFPKSIRGSTPKIEGTCQVTDSLNEADIAFCYHIPCPHCDRLQVLEWGGSKADFGVKWENDDPKTAHYRCRHCDDKFFYPDMPKVWDRGKWMAEDGSWIDEDGDLRNADGEVIEFPKHVGFDRYSSLYSIFFTWPQLVDQYLKAVDKARQGDDTKLKAFINTRLGETWKEDVGEKPSDLALHGRREEYNAEVPSEVLFITAGVDTQDDRFEFEVVGWGRDEESWSLDYSVLMGSPSQQQVWDVLGEMLRRQYRRADGLMMEIGRVCHDSGGHYTDEVYEFSKKMGLHWLIPTKGASIYGKPIADFPKKRDKKGVHLTIIGTENAKDLIYARLGLQNKGPGYCHFPVKEGAYDEQYFRGLTCEHKKLDYSRGRPVYKYVCPQGMRNEPLDCRVGALAALRISQQYFGLDLDHIVPATARPPEQREVRRKSSYWSK